MSDRYQQLVNNPIGRRVAKNVGLPSPVQLARYTPGEPLLSGPALLGAAPGGRLVDAAAAVLADANAEVHRAQLDGEQHYKALVFDASGIASSAELRELYAFFHPSIRGVQECGRVVVLGTPPEHAGDVRAATAQRALEGFVRAVAKEVGRGATAQLIYVAPGGEDQLASTLRFFLSAKSAYVSAQVVRVGPSELHPDTDWERPLHGKVALVTGASRGIGESIATTLARDGALIVGLDVPALADELHAVAKRIGGGAITTDITAADAPATIAGHLQREHGGVDVVVHNAGVTRDKTLGRMSEDAWSTLIDINLSSAERIDDELLGAGLIRDNGRIIGVSSISGIAGNAGQTNYSTSKAGVIGRVQALAPTLPQGITINAVAPGFIETQMTAAMPFAIREAGRRMNSMSQGGLPLDVAETIAWFAAPASAGVTGNIVRVCGQSLLGA
jgi:3-oxoacyl-[acyl-carrier protein] reductase